MAYTKTNWVNDSEPSINAANLNKIENGIFNADQKAETADDKANTIISTNLPAKEDVSNKTTDISSSSTDTQYPSAKAVYTAINAGGGLAEKEDKSNKISAWPDPSDSSAWIGKYPNAGLTYNTFLDKQSQINAKENESNKVSVIATNNTDTTHYPATQAVATFISNLINNLRTQSITSSDETRFPSSKAVYDGLEEKETAANRVATDITSSNIDGTHYPSTQAVVNYIGQFVISKINQAIDFGTFEPTVYSDAGTTEVTTVTKQGFYTRVGNIVFFRLMLNQTTGTLTQFTLGAIEKPVAMQTAAQKPNGVAAYNSIKAFKYTPGATTPAAESTVKIPSANTTIQLNTPLTVDPSQGQVAEISGAYICG